jgi:hypothetical protein
LSASEFRATQKISVSNSAPTKNFSVGDKFHVSTTDVDAVNITGNLVAQTLKIGNLLVSPTFDLAAVSNVGNTTSNTLQFANATTSFVASSNVEIGGNITLTSNAQVKVGSNVLAEYTGPHGREPKEMPLKKFPEIAFEEGKFDYNTTTNTFTQAGYTITSSSNYGADDVNSAYTAWRAFTGLTNGYGPGWTSGGGGTSHPSTYTSGSANSNQSLTNIDTATSTGSVSSRNGAWVKLELPTKIKLGRVDFYDRYDDINVNGGGQERVSEAFVYGGNSNSGPWYEIGKQSDATNMAHYTDDNPASLTINTTSYYKYYIIQPTAQENLNRVYVSYGQLMFYGTEEPAPPGDLSLDTTLKSTFNSVRSNNYVMYFDGDGFIPGDNTSNNLVDNKSVIHHNATYDSTGKYWTLDGSTESNVTTGSLGFEGDVPHTVSTWINASNLEANALTQQLFSIGSGYSEEIVRVDDTQIAANTWHNLTYAYQGEGGSKVTYVDGRKVEEAQVEDTFGEYPPFPMTDYKTGGYCASASSEFPHATNYKAYQAFDDIVTGNNALWLSGNFYGTNGVYTGSESTTVSGTAYSGEWLQIELPHKLKVSYVAIQPQNDALERSPLNGVIAGSNDGTTWNLLDSFTGITTSSSPAWSATVPVNFTLNSTNAYKYFRFVATSLQSTTTYYASIQNVQLYGHKEGDLTRFPEPTRVLKYPHVTFPSSSVGASGLGIGPAHRGYVVTTNSENTNYPVQKVFDERYWVSTDDSQRWQPSGSNFPSDGTVALTTGGSTTVPGSTPNPVRGDFIQLESPHKLVITKFKIFCGPSSASLDIYRPTRARIVGSNTNNGTDWVDLGGGDITLPTYVTENGNLATTASISNTTAYKYHRLIIRSIAASAIVVIFQLQFFGTQENTGTPAIVGGPFAGKVANFRVYDQYLGDERIQEIYDAQKDEFGHKKSSMTFYKGRIGVGTTEPEGALTVIDEPHALQKFPVRAISADDSYVEGDGQIKLSVAKGTGYRAFDGLTSTSWTATPTRNTRLSEEVDFGAWLKIQTPESMSLKKAEIESRPDWAQVGSDINGSALNDQLGRAVACSHDGTRIIAGGHAHNGNAKGMVRVYDWNGTTWELIGNQTLTGTADLDKFGSYVAISGDGNIIAVAAPFEHVSGDADKGTVRVYYLNGSTWTILPDSGSLTDASLTDVFVGSAANMFLGNGTLKLSYDGKTIAMCEYGYDISGKNDVGRVLVYKYSDGAWSYKGTGATQFVGDTADAHFGFGLSMSEDGNCLAIGTRDAGYFIEVYNWDGSSWNIKGLRLSESGLNGNDDYGTAISISNDGNTLAVGARNADLADGASGAQSGLVFVYHWTGSAWGTPHKLQYNETADEDFGISVELSGDGKRLIVGASAENSSSGELFTFEYTGTSWIMRTAGVIGANGGTSGHLGYGPDGDAHAVAISRDGSTILGGELGYNSGFTNSGRVRVFSMPSTIKSIWGSNDDVNWTKITTAPTREEATSNVAGLVFGYDDRLEFKNLDNPNYYKYHAIVADAFTQLKEVKLFGVRNQGSSTLHDGTLTLTKNLDVPRIGPPLDADDTPRRDRLVVEYNTSTNPVEDDLVQDTSGRGNDGIITSSVTYDSTSKEFDFAGDNDWIESPALGWTGAQPHSVSVWIKLDVMSNPNSTSIQNAWTIRKPNSTDAASRISELHIFSNGTIEWAWHSNNNTTAINKISAGQYYHIVCVYNGGAGNTASSRRMWINGVEETFATVSSTASAINFYDTATFAAGYDQGLDNYDLDGKMSSIKLYDTALTAEEVKTLYDMGRCDEGGHVVNFSKTRVGIGLGDGEAPRGALDVKGALDVRGVANFGSRVGVGTDDPATNLHLLGVGNGLGPRLRFETLNNGNSTYTPSGTEIGGIQFGADDLTWTTQHMSSEIVGIQSEPNYSGARGIIAFKTSSSQGASLTEKMRIRFDGNVGIGTAVPYAKLHVWGASGNFTTSGTSPSRASYFINSSDLYVNTTANFGNASIYGSNDIIAGGWVASFIGTINASDTRIKTEIVDVEDGSALETLRLLKPKKYKYVDKVRQGTEPVWGFIAQEVRDTLPYASQLRTECVPNIYELANVSASNVITFSNFDTSNLESNAMVLKVFDKDDMEHLVNITEVVDDHSVRVEEDLSEWTGSVDESGNVVTGNHLFVYGQQVDDFVFLKKDAIWTVATSALQEVDRQLQAEKAKVTTLETQLTSVLARLDALESA